MNLGLKFWKQTQYGKFKFNWIVLIYLPIIILTPCYTYYMCVIKNHQCKAGHSTITQTANHFPQNTYFRFNMGVSTSMLILIYYVLNRWISIQAKRCGFEQPSKIAYYSMLVAMVFESIAVETIDGYKNGPLHGPSAVIFFLTFEIVIVYLTLYLYRLRQWNTSVISLRSLQLKMALAFYVTGVWIYCLYGAATSKQNKIDFTVVVEWNAFLIDLLWLLSFAEQWGKIKLCLISITPSTPTEEIQM